MGGWKRKWSARGCCKDLDGDAEGSWKGRGNERMLVHVAWGGFLKGVKRLEEEETIEDQEASFRVLILQLSRVRFPGLSQFGIN